MITTTVANVEQMVFVAKKEKEFCLNGHDAK